MCRIISDEELMEDMFMDPEIEAMEAQEQEYNRHRRKHVLSFSDMDRMTDEEIDEWYKYHGIYRE